MANEQANADAAYRAFQAAVARANTVTASSPNSQAAYQARQALAQAEAASNAANAAVQATWKPANTAPAGPPAKTAEDAYWETQTRLANEQAASQAREQREGASTYLTQILSQYGLGSLSGQIDSLINQWGTNTGVIAEKLKQTEPYKVRFKGLTALQAKGVTDVANEAEYLNLETEYRKAFRESGLQSFLGAAGTQTEQDAIARLAGDFSLSVNEVRDRITDAQRVVADTPQEVRDSLQRYYNVDPSTLVSYVLDPTKTASQVNRLANEAIIGGYGTRAGLDITLAGASGVADLAQGNDLNVEALQNDLAAARAVRDETRRLAEIEGKTLSDTEAFQAQLKTDANATEKIKGLQSSERARFGGSSGIGKGALTRPNTF